MPEVRQENMEKPYRRKGEASLQLVGLREAEAAVEDWSQNNSCPEIL